MHDLRLVRLGVLFFSLSAMAALGCDGSTAKLAVDGGGGDAAADGGPDLNPDDTGGSPACTPPTLTYANFGMRFIETYCYRCHGFSQTSAQQVGSDLYLAAVADGDNSFMPPVDPRPTLAERTNFGVWLNCGAP